MRIYGPNGSNAVATSTPARRTSSGTFSIGAEDAPRGAPAAAPPRILGGIDALIALQGYEDPADRRRRAVKRGRAALDALEALKLAMLSGTLDTAALAALKTAAAGLADRTGEPDLDTLLAEIELRVEVELAKIGMPPTAGNRSE